MARLILRAVVCLLTFFHISAFAEKPIQITVPPAYRVDLTSVIKQPFAFEPWGAPEGAAGTPIRSLEFLDNQRLAATVVTRAEEPGLSARDKATGSAAFRLNAVVMEVSSGKLLATPVWPSNSRFAGIVAVNDNGFVTQTGRDLTLFSPDIKVVKAMTLPTLPPNQYTGERYWNPRPSWSGTRLLLLGQVFWLRGPWLWLDAENLRVIRSWDEVLTGSIGVSNEQLVMGTGGRRFGGPPPSLEIAIPGENWEPVPATLNASAPQFVAPQLLYFRRLPSTDRPANAGAFLMRTDTGQVSRLESPRKGWGLSKAAPSRKGNGFVILVEQLKGSHPSLDMSGHTELRAFQVYKSPFKELSCTLLVRDSQTRNPDHAVLSPDGRHLAVFSYPEPIIEVFDLSACQ